MSTFEEEIARLRNLLHRGYLQRDPKVTAIRGVTSKPALMGGVTSQIFATEAKAVADLDLNTVRIDWIYNQSDRELYLNTFWSYGIKTVFLTPFPVGTPPPARHWHYDPFNSDTNGDGIADPDVVLEQWKTMLDTRVFAQYADDPRIYGFELIGEPDIADNHRSHMNQLGQYAQANCSREIFISLDIYDDVLPLAPCGSLINYHYYQFLCRVGGSIIDITNELRSWISTWKTLGKPVLIGETGFPTYLVYPSNSGNTPYQIATINATTLETEELQYDYLANILHTIKETDILGYLIYQWVDDVLGGEGGFGLNTCYPELRRKKALELLATTPLKYVFKQWQDGDTNPVKTITV